MFSKKLILQEQYFDKTFNDNSLIGMPSKKYITTKNKELSDILTTINKLEPKSKIMEDNINGEERKALAELRLLTKSKIEIKKADKTNTFVVMDKDTYKNTLVLQGHLNTATYEQAPQDANSKVYRALVKLCDKYPNCTTKKERNVILSEDWCESNFYVLPKVHKSSMVASEIKKRRSEYIHMRYPSDLKSRPINGDVKSVTQGLSKLIEKILGPLVVHLKTYVKDEFDFIRKFPTKIPRNSYIMCCDVTSLYTSIPHELGLRAVDYWVDKLAYLIPTRFSKPFILESIKFILENNFFLFDNVVWHQLCGTAMGKSFAPPYACLTVGYLEETVLFPTLLPSHFGQHIASQIIELLFRYIDDDIVVVPDIISPEQFLEVLNKMNSSVQFTITKQTRTTYFEEDARLVNFLAIKVIQLNDGSIKTDVFYKETNAHDYQHYTSHHPTHTKDNIPFSLAKRIIFITSDERQLVTNLNDLRGWLRAQGYPNHVIEKGIHNASLQGPAPPPTNQKIVPLITPFLSNYDITNILDTTKDLLKNTKNPRLQQAFKDVRFIQSYSQPRNLLNQLSCSRFVSDNPVAVSRPPGIHLCENSGCKICALYLQPCCSFTTSNGTIWNVKCHATCHSKNTLYFMVCNFCNTTSKTGLTDNFRDRTNNHITGCRWGRGTDIFDNHVFACSGLQNVPHEEPYFKIYIYMVLNDYHKLLNYERKLHLAGHDTLNKPSCQ